MKRSLAVLTVSVALALSACGAGGSDYSTLSKKQVSASLLTVDDLGSGWKRDKDTSDSDDDDFHVLKGNASCKRLFSDEGEENEIDSADVSFTKDDFAPFLAEEVITNKAGTAEEDFSTLSDAIKGCRTFVSDLDESKPIVTLRPAEGPDLGDESLAFTFTAKIPDVPTFKARGIAVRLGDNVVLITSLGLEGKEIAAAKLRELVEKSVANVEKRAVA